MNQVKELKEKQAIDLTVEVDNRVKELLLLPETINLKKIIEDFESDPFGVDGAAVSSQGLYLDDSGMLNAYIDLDLGDLNFEEFEVIEAVLEEFCDFGYFEQTQYSQGPREWRLSQCLGEPTIFNESPDRHCYAIYSGELDLAIQSVIDTDHGFALIEQAMRKAGVFENIVSTDYYGLPTLLSMPKHIVELSDEDLQIFIDLKEENINY